MLAYRRNGLLDRPSMKASNLGGSQLERQPLPQALQQEFPLSIAARGLDNRGMNWDSRRVRMKTVVRSSHSILAARLLVGWLCFATTASCSLLAPQREHLRSMSVLEYQAIIDAYSGRCDESPISDERYRCHHDLGAAYWMLGNYPGAASHYERAAEHFESEGDFFSAAVYANAAGKAHESAGDTESSLAKYEEAIGWDFENASYRLDAARAARLLAEQSPLPEPLLGRSKKLYSEHRALENARAAALPYRRVRDEPSATRAMVRVLNRHGLYNLATLLRRKRRPLQQPGPSL